MLLIIYFSNLTNYIISLIQIIISIKIYLIIRISFINALSSYKFLHISNYYWIIHAKVVIFLSFMIIPDSITIF